MTIHDLFSIALRQVIRNRRRYKGAILSLALGTAGILMTLTMGEAIEKQIAANLESLGRATVIKARWDFDRKTRWHHGQFGPSDVQALWMLHGVADVTGFVSKTDITFANADNKIQGQLLGVESNFFSALRLSLAHGSEITAQDVSIRQHVCVIGSTLAHELFRSFTNPVNSSVSVDGRVFRIVGVLGGVEEREYSRSLFAPISVVWDNYFGEPTISEIQVRATHWGEVEKLREEVIKILQSLHPGFSQGLEVIWHPEKIRAISVVEGLVKFLLFTGLSLVMILGGSAMTNLMYLAVEDRTSEIGVRMAMGATNYDIMRQFLVESIVTTFSGIVAGLALGVYVVMMMKMAFDLTPDYGMLCLGIVGCMVLGIVLGLTSGLKPSRKASLLDPAEAIRFE